jgi:hypothetical protein
MHSLHVCGFKCLGSAERFCRVSEEGGTFFRVRSRRNESGSWAWPRAVHLGRRRVLMPTLAGA